MFEFHVHLMWPYTEEKATPSTSYIKPIKLIIKLIK